MACIRGDGTVDPRGVIFNDECIWKTPDVFIAGLITYCDHELSEEELEQEREEYLRELPHTD